MKKQISKLFIVGFTALAMFSSCNKDNVSQEDVIVDQQLVDFVIRVLDAGNNEPLDSAAVEIVNGSEIATVTTDEAGLAVFKDVKISNSTPVTISKSNYIKISSYSNLTPNDYRQQQITSEYKLYSTKSENVVTITGILTIETNVTNIERETVPAGLEIKAFNNSMATDVAFIAETDANGKYTITVPVSQLGNDDIQLDFPEITANQTVAVSSENDDYAINLIERPTHYALNASSGTSILALPSAYAVVDAPPTATAGTGFNLGVKANRLTFSSYSSYELISGGSGYSDTTTFLELSPDPDGNKAWLYVNVTDGVITSITGINNNSATYDAAPTINTSVKGGSGAEIHLMFETTYNIYIENNGSGYSSYPEIYYDYDYYSGNTLYQRTSSMSLSDYANLTSSGIFINDNYNDGDTIATWNGWASAPEFTIVQPESKQIYINFDYDDINSIGQITSYNRQSYGYGYDPATPPSVTVVAVGGYGSGADLHAELNSSGQLSTIDIVNRGSGYRRNINDFRNNNTYYSTSEDPTFSYGYSYSSFRTINNVKAGSTLIRSAHYGTGTSVEDF
jgi:hypothetical protein